MNLGDAVLTLKVDDQGLSKGLDAAKGKAVGFTASLKDLVIGLGTVAAAKQIIKFLGDCLNSFIESEMAATKLTSALRATGQEYVNTSASLQRYAKELQKVSIYSDEAIMGAEAMLIQLSNLTEAGVREMTPAVMDLAAAMGIDLVTAAQMVGKVLEGSTTSLGRTGVKIKETQDPAERFDLVIQQLTEHFGGMAVALGKTTGGQLTQFKNQVDEVKESVGGFLASFVQGYVIWGKELSASLQTVWWYMKQVWAIWTDLTNLRDPFGKDSQANLLVMAERQKQLSEQMLVYEGLQTAASKKTNEVAKATAKVVEVYKGYRQTLDDVGVEHGQLRTLYDDELEAINKLAAAGSEYVEGSLADTELMFAAMREEAALRQDVTDREMALLRKSADLKKRLDAEEMERKKKILNLAISISKSMFEEIGRDLAAGELSWKSFGEAALHVLGKIISALGDELAASAAADIVKAWAALASIFGAWMAPGFFASAAIKFAGAAASWVAGATLSAIKLEHGGEFTVPPGYPNDSFPVRVESGEHVKVTPFGANDGGMIHNTLVLDGVVLADWVTKASRNKRILTTARSVVP